LYTFAPLGFQEAAMDETIRFRLNGRPTEITVDPDRRFLWVLRTELGLTGVKYGCGEALCGSCTVLIGNRAVRSCATPARAIEGVEVTTIEGLASASGLHPVQQAFVNHEAMQCGYCTPGMILGAVGLLNANPDPSGAEILEGMEGHLCRCGTYARVIQAVRDAAESMAAEGPGRAR
jgi:aerobic-type carbon monoxide dehydrogenase small subunit (CoxS/CutS family)